VGSAVVAVVRMMILLAIAVLVDVHYLKLTKKEGWKMIHYCCCCYWTRRQRVRHGGCCHEELIDRRHLHHRHRDDDYYCPLIEKRWQRNHH